MIQIGGIVLQRSSNIGQQRHCAHMRLGAAVRGVVTQGFEPVVYMAMLPGLQDRIQYLATRDELYQRAPVFQIVRSMRKESAHLRGSKSDCLPDLKLASRAIFPYLRISAMVLVGLVSSHVAPMQDGKTNREYCVAVDEEKSLPRLAKNERYPKTRDILISI